eukprot:PhM_4_TR5669/c0_g1_i1/m.3632
MALSRQLILLCVAAVCFVSFLSISSVPTDMVPSTQTRTVGRTSPHHTWENDNKIILDSESAAPYEPDPPTTQQLSQVELTEDNTGPAPAVVEPPSPKANGAANRSPYRPKTTLFPQPLTPHAPLNRAEVVCYGLRGEGTDVPAWMPALLGKAKVGLETIRSTLSADPWSILIVWVPSRFMGPQPKGRNSQDEEIEPPTRGRDPKFYLNEYNASWHATVSSSGREYYAQVMHKNSLAVCIRERLHIVHFRCGTSKNELVPFYFCQCRHCSEESAGRTSGKVAAHIPREAHKPARLPPLYPPKLPNATCVRALSAPWLFPESVLPHQPYEGLHGDLPALLKAVADENRVVFVYIFNKFWVDHLHNCVFSMVHSAGVTNYIIATMDTDALALCRKNRLPCFDATEYAEPEADMKVGGVGYKKGATRKVSEAMSWIKPRLAVAILKLGFAFFMADLDMTWFRNPLGDVWRHPEDVVHQCDTVNVNSVNSGFYLAKPTQSAIEFFEHLMVFRPEENADQTAMKLFFRYDHTHGATHTCLNKWAYNMKCNYKKEGTVKKEVTKYAKQTFVWVPQDKDRSKMASWYILHATCLSGAVAKMLYLRTNNAWLLDDLDEMTSSSSRSSFSYCAVLPDGSEVHNLRQQTQHSSSYVRNKEPYFLKERH